MAHRNFIFLSAFQNVQVTPPSSKICEVNTRFVWKTNSGLRDFQFGSLGIRCSSVFDGSAASLEIGPYTVVREGDRILNMYVGLDTGYWWYMKTLLEGSLVQRNTLVLRVHSLLTHCSWNSEMYGVGWGWEWSVLFLLKGRKKPPANLACGNCAVFPSEG